MGIFEDIASLKIQGARQIAVESLKYLDRLSQKSGFGKDFEIEAKKLASARPTAVMLHNAVDILLKSRSQETLHSLLERIESDEKMIAYHGRKLIKNGFQVHTHCHSSEALSIIKDASKHNKFMVFVNETRPFYQGRITASELSNIRNLTVSFGVDSAAGPALSGIGEKKDDMFLVGCDSLRKEGFVNKIGTYMMAVAAKENRVPFYVAASTLKLDRRKRIDIEHRQSSEVWEPQNRDIIIRNPAFETVPWKYVTAVVTEKGILKPERVVKMI